MKRSGRVIALLVLLVATSFGFAESTTAEPGDYDLARLGSGEVLLQTIHSDKPGGAARATALFYTTADAVWNVIGYCKYELIYIRGLELCEVLESGKNDMRMHHRIRGSWYTPTLDFSFAASRLPGNIGEAHLLAGNLKVLAGQWRIIPLADENSVIVIHEIRVQPKVPAPRWLIRRSLRKDLPDMLACIRGLANASGDDRRIRADLERCAGDVTTGKLPGP